MAITIRVGHSLGEGKTEQAQRATQVALVLAPLLRIFCKLYSTYSVSYCRFIQ